MAEADARRGPDAAAVGAAMGERVGHRLDPRRIDRLGHVGMEDAGDAAHRLTRSPAARSASGSTGPSAREEGVDRGRALMPSARLGRDQDRHRALRPAEQAHLHRLQLHPHPAPGHDIADPVEARRPRAPSPCEAIRSARPSGGARRVGGPGPGALRRDRALAEADQLAALAPGGRRRRWRGRPSCPAPSR